MKINLFLVSLSVLTVLQTQCMFSNDDWKTLWNQTFYNELRVAPEEPGEQPGLDEIPNRPERRRK